MITEVEILTLLIYLQIFEKILHSAFKVGFIPIAFLYTTTMYNLYDQGCHQWLRHDR